MRPPHLDLLQRDDTLGFMNKKSLRAFIKPFMVLAITVSVAAVGCKKKEEVAPSSPLTVIPENINRGSRVFQQKCQICHKVQGEGGKQGRDLSRAGRTYDRQYLRSVLEHGKYPPEMPSFADMPREDREALIDYLMSLK